MGSSEFPGIPHPPIEPFQFRVVPDNETPGHVPMGFVQLEDQMKRAYLVAGVHGGNTGSSGKTESGP